MKGYRASGPFKFSSNQPHLLCGAAAEVKAEDLEWFSIYVAKRFPSVFLFYS